MKDQELFGQLHKLSKMQPDAEWKAAQRNIMLNQINMTAGDTKQRSLFWELGRLPLSFVNNFSQPLSVAIVVAFVMLTGGLVSLKAAQDTKPGDSLYVAKIMGEKTQFALTFSEKGKAQLGLEFAVKRAEEIKQVMDMDGDGEAKDDKVEKLVGDFKKELDAAKTRISKISEANPVAAPQNENESEENKDQVVATATDDRDAENKEAPSSDTESEEKIFSAGSEKADSGLSVSKTEDKNNNTNKPATSTAVRIDARLAAPKSPEKILEEASALLKAEAYNEAVSVLEEAGPAIDQTFNQGEVKGVEEGEGVEGTEEIGSSSEDK